MSRVEVTEEKRAVYTARFSSSAESPDIMGQVYMISEKTLQQIREHDGVVEAYYDENKSLIVKFLPKEHEIKLLQHDLRWDEMQQKLVEAVKHMQDLQADHEKRMERHTKQEYFMQKKQFGTSPYPRKRWEK